MKYSDRQELNALSKEVFGSASRWEKIYKLGVLIPYVDEEAKPIHVAGKSTHHYYIERNGLHKIKEFMLAAKAAAAKGEVPAEDVPKPASFLTKLKGLFKKEKY